MLMLMLMLVIESWNGAPGGRAPTIVTTYDRTNLAWLDEAS